MKLTEHVTDTWRPHPRVIDALEVDQWTIKCEDVDLLANAKLLHAYVGRLVFESLSPVGHGKWIRTRISVWTDKPVVHFWSWLVYGDTATEDPTFPSRQLHITSINPPCLDVPIQSDSLEHMLHGQGTSVRHYWVDFDEVKVGYDNGSILKPNLWCPANPNQTGGGHLYMGITITPPDPEELYMLGGYGGYFQHGNDGRWVTEGDFPDLQANSHIHEHSTDRGWISYTDPSAPWRDPMRVFEVNQDGQHMSLFSVLAYAVHAHPQDEGLQMLLEASVHVFCRAFPAQPRGTFHHNSGAERAQGRILKTAVDVYQALRDRKLALTIGRRGVERYKIDMAAAIERLKQGQLPFHGFRNGYGTNEIGIHYWGMHRLHTVLEAVDAVDELPTLNIWMDKARRWCFESFRYYDMPGDRRWSHPYVEDENHLALEGPVSSAHFAWLAATHYEPINPSEREKMRELALLGEHYARRFKG